MRNQTKVNWVSKLEPILPKEGSVGDTLLKIAVVATVLVAIKLVGSRHELQYKVTKRPPNWL